MAERQAHSGPEVLDAGKAEFCRAVLEDLPEWFGIPEAIDNYCAESERCPMYAITVDGAPAGLVTVDRITPDTSEIVVIAVCRRFRNKGFGRALVGCAENHARADGARLLSVKTLGASHPDPHYSETRAMYEALGFLAVEEFSNLWGEGVPALLYVKTL